MQIHEMKNQVCKFALGNDGMASTLDRMLSFEGDLNLDFRQCINRLCH